MKQIQITLPSDRRTLLDQIIKEYSVSATSYDFGPSIRYELVVDDYQTNILIEELKARGIGSAYGTIVVSPVSLIISSTEVENNIPTSAGVNRQEILANLGNISGFASDYLLLSFLASALAAFGLLNNDAVVIIASMIVAPLLGPILLTSLGLLGLKTFPYVKKGLFAEFMGIVTVIITAALIGGVFQYFASLGILEPVTLTTELLNRTKLNIATVSLALLGGLAAGIVVARGLDVSIVGVAIAASLCPPAATIGILTALGEVNLAFQAAGLLLLNIFAINLSCTLVFWNFGVKSSGLSKRQSEKVRRLNTIWIVVVTLLLLAILIIADVIK
ncbi:MAG: TIGR00341 family protein [Candidatus Hodarchaeales archaeon]